MNETRSSLTTSRSWIILAAALFAVATIVWPGAPLAGAAAPAPVVELNAEGVTFVEADGGCTIELLASWDSAELRGPNANTRLYELVGEGLELEGAGFRVTDTGTARFVVRGEVPGDHTYRFALVRGGQERVLASVDRTVTCS